MAGAAHKRVTSMSLDSIDSNKNEERDLVAESSWSISYALEALSELHGAEPERVTQPAPIEAPLSPQEQSPEGEGEGEGRLASLQSALDWYKDWLGSM